MREVTITELKRMTVAEIKEKKRIKVMADGELIAFVIAVDDKEALAKIKNLHL